MTEPNVFIFSEGWRDLVKYRDVILWKPSFQAYHLPCNAELRRFSAHQASERERPQGGRNFVPAEKVTEVFRMAGKKPLACLLVIIDSSGNPWGNPGVIDFVTP